MFQINKPLMEKKRRERINNCLNQLKMFLMDATKKDVSNKEPKKDSPTVSFSLSPKKMKECVAVSIDICRIPF